MKHLFFILIIILFYSCSKDELGPQCVNCEENAITSTNNTDVVIVNEGNFGSGSGSITVYNDSTQSVTQNVFFQSNGFQIGNVAQSITQFNDKAYIVINNSNKIEVADIDNFNSLATITGFNSPRYFLPINNNKAYVTDLYSNSIQIVDLNTNSITGNISVNGWTEQLLLHNDTVYICDMTNNNLLLFNAQTDAFIDSIKVGTQPNSLVLDANNKIWILCSGGINEAIPALIKFNPSNRTTENTFLFSTINESPSNLKINKAKNTLYFINSSVYKMDISSTNLPNTALINSSSNIFYGLGINPKNSNIYVSDAIDYVQNGTVFRYDSLGILLHQFPTGIIPGNFMFIE
jgi:hypothetical protein